MILFLLLNVPFDITDHRVADGNRCVSLLPCELRFDEIVFIDPVGGLTFDILEDVFYRVVGIKKNEGVKVIGDSVDRLQVTLEIMLQMVSDVRVEMRFETVTVEGFVAFCAEECVDLDLGS